MFSRLIKILSAIVTAKSVGSELENYIMARDPQDSADIERLERDYQISIQRNSIFYSHE